MAKSKKAAEVVVEVDEKARQITIMVEVPEWDDLLLTPSKSNKSDMIVRGAGGKPFAFCGKLIRFGFNMYMPRAK